jgi:hypothetical protein
MESNNILPDWWHKWNNSIWMEWLFRMFFSLTFIQTACVMQDEHYPDACWLLLFVSIWLYFFKQKILTFIPIFFALFIHYVHHNLI